MEYDSNKAHYVAATVIVVKDGKYLITKRASTKDDFGGRWTVPGGKLEKKDYINSEKESKYQWYNVLEKLAKREVKEETNLEIEKIDYVTSLVFIRKDGVPALVISLYADYKSGEVKLGEEETDYAWVTLEEAKNYDLIEGIYEEIEMLDKILKGEKVGEWEKK